MKKPVKAGNTQGAAAARGAGWPKWLAHPAAPLALAFILYLGVRWYILGTMAPLRYSDTESYINQYRNGFGEGFFGRIRTWGYPLVFWAARFHEGLVMSLQRLAGALAWFGLAWAAARLFRSRVARGVAFWGTLAISLALFSMIWDAMLLSESFSNSFYIGLTAALAWFLGERGAGLRPLGALAALTIPFASLRDSNLFPLYLLMACLAVALGFRHFRGPGPRPARRALWIGLGLIAAIGLVCLVHTLDMKRCRRNWQSVGAVFSMRIYMKWVQGENGEVAAEDGRIYAVANEDNLKWLAEHYNLPVEEARSRILKTVYHPPPLPPVYEQWLKETGARALMGFMAAHPKWVAVNFIGYPLYRLNMDSMYMQSPEAWSKAHLWLARAVQTGVNLTVEKVLRWMWINILLMTVGAGFGLGWLARGWRHGPDAWTGRMGLMFWLIASALIIIFVSIFGDYYEIWRHAITGLMALYAAAPLGLAMAAEVLSGLIARRLKKSAS